MAARSLPDRLTRKPSRPKAPEEAPHPSTRPTDLPADEHFPEADKVPISTHLSLAREALGKIEGRLASLDQHFEHLENIARGDEVSTPGATLSFAISGILNTNLRELEDLRKWLGHIQDQAYREETGRKGART